MITKVLSIYAKVTCENKVYDAKSMSAKNMISKSMATKHIIVDGINIRTNSHVKYYQHSTCLSYQQGDDQDLRRISAKKNCPLMTKWNLKKTLKKEINRNKPFCISCIHYNLQALNHNYLGIVTKNWFHDFTKTRLKNFCKNLDLCWS